jgi:hypothetical protein
MLLTGKINRITITTIDAVICEINPYSNEYVKSLNVILYMIVTKN